MKMIKRWVVAAVAVMVLCASTVRAQVVQQIPSDALVVFKVNNLKAVSDKFGKLAQDLGLVGFMPELSNPLGAAQGSMQMQQGINPSGELAVAFLDPALAGGDSDKSVMIFAPVSDYKAFLTNSPQATTEGEVSQVQFGGAPMFAANWGQYAVLSPTKALVARKPSTPMAVPAVSSKELASKDAIFYANFTALRAKLIPNLQQARASITAEAQQALAARAGENPKMAPIIKAVINQAFSVMEGFLNDTQGATLGVNLAPEGLNWTVLADFRSGSYAATNIASTPNTDATLLSGLPAGKYLIYGGGTADPKRSVKVLSDLIDPIVKEVLAFGPEMAPVQDYVTALKAAMGAATGQSFGVLAPTGALGAEPLVQAVVIQKGDPKVLIDSQIKMAEIQQQLMKTLKLPGTEGMMVTRKSAARTIDGIAFDSMTTSVDPNVQNAAAQQQAEMLKLVYGPQGAVVHYAAVGDRMLMFSGVNEQVVRNTIASIKGNTAPLENDPALKEVVAQLPKQRVGVVFVNVAEIATTTLNYMKQFGFNMPVQLPPGLPPIAASLSSEQGTALRVDVHVPKTLVQSMIAAGMQAAMQMQGGGGPRGGGL